jgi:hypothetical protein
MRSTLRERNLRLGEQLTQVRSFIEGVEIVPELEPYRNRLLEVIKAPAAECARNIILLDLNVASLQPDIVSNTRSVIRTIRLLSTSFLRPLFRSSRSDRICLKTIEWMHAQHSKTKDLPAAFADDACSIAPIIQISPVYFFPCLEQRGLLFQPLFYHEFGHVLYQVHEKELDDLVFELQRSISGSLSPLSQRNDRYSDAQAADLQSVVDAWYHWAQELFCDAVGLSIGGPAFLEAFSAYMHQFEIGDFYLPVENLRGKSHPISWLRMRYLLLLARDWGLDGVAKRVETLWEETRNELSASDDYHGYFEPSFDPFVRSTLSDMLIEASPRRFTPSEISEGGDAASRDQNLEWPALLNEAWFRYHRDPDEYSRWEYEQCERVLAHRSAGQNPNQ